MSQEETGNGNLPATEDDLKDMGLPSGVQMATGLQVFFNERLYNKCARLASVMSKAEGMTQKHLIGKPEACFAVISRAITWNLDPFAVAQATYQTPGGSIGFMGVLVQAILENSGRLEGGLKFKLDGDWTKVKGKFQILESQRGGKYPAPTWTRDDAKGLKVVVSARVRGETEDRAISVDLDECFPLNSPLWATSPSTQICYLAARRFANLAMPGVMMGVPFDIDPTNFYGEPMTDVTPPRPARNEFERPAQAATNAPATAPEKAQETQAQTAAQETAKPAAASAAPAVHEAEPVREQAQATVAQEATVVHEAGHIQDDRPTQAAEPEETVEQLQRRILEESKVMLASAKNMREVSDLRKEVSDNLTGDELHAWEKACDARSKEILQATAKKPTGAKR